MLAHLTEMRERAESGGSAAALAGLVMQLEADVDDAVSASDRASPEPFGAVRRRFHPKGKALVCTRAFRVPNRASKHGWNRRSSAYGLAGMVTVLPSQN